MDILYQDEALCVCIKPVGLDSQIGVPEALKAQLGGEFYPVHRLDENVGGVMVYARTSKAAAMLSREIQAGTFVKVPGPGPRYAPGAGGLGGPPVQGQP